jgi:Tripartite tricarboxylate transporter TctB family
MTLRTDHVSGAFFIGIGLLVIALSGDLPIGSLSSPGAGFMPNILAVLTIVFGITLVLRAKESKPFAEVSWNDAKHAGMVVALTAAATAVFEWLGFVTSNVLLIFALLVVIERRRLLPAAAYSIGLVVFTYVLFVYALKTPLEAGPFGF